MEGTQEPDSPQQGRLQVQPQGRASGMKGAHAFVLGPLASGCSILASQEDPTELSGCSRIIPEAGLLSPFRLGIHVVLYAWSSESSDCSAAEILILQLSPAQQPLRGRLSVVSVDIKNMVSEPQDHSL